MIGIVGIGGITVLPDFDFGPSTPFIPAISGPGRGLFPQGPTTPGAPDPVEFFMGFVPSGTGVFDPISGQVTGIGVSVDVPLPPEAPQTPPLPLPPQFPQFPGTSPAGGVGIDVPLPPEAPQTPPLPPLPAGTTEASFPDPGGITEEPGGDFRFPPLIPLPRIGGGDGGPMAELVDILRGIEQTARTVGAVASVFNPPTEWGGWGAQQLVLGAAAAGGVLGAPAGACPPARPRMPTSLQMADPCAPNNPTFYLKAGKASAAMWPNVLASQAKKLGRANKAVPKKTVRRKKGK